MLFFTIPSSEMKYMYFVEQGSEFSDDDTPFDGIAQVDRHVSYTKSL